MMGTEAAAVSSESDAGSGRGGSGGFIMSDPQQDHQKASTSAELVSAKTQQVTH